MMKAPPGKNGEPLASKFELFIMSHLVTSLRHMLRQLITATLLNLTSAPCNHKSNT